MNEQTDAALAAAGKVVTGVGGGTAFLGGLSANDIAAFAGVVGMVIGLAVQWYFSRRKDQRELAEHRARMKGFDNGQ
ncbi:TPA: hypothetical protein QEL15_004295 [Stenotrophomonas maltophilia]|nr:hypothetical protein [Stenotrophomonas maltophilia]